MEDGENGGKRLWNGYMAEKSWFLRWPDGEKCEKVSKMASEKFSSKVDILDWAWSEVEYMFSGSPNGPKRHPKSLVSMGLCGRQMSIKCLFSAWFGRILTIISTPALWIKHFWSTHVDQTFAKSQTISKLILSLFTTTTHALKRLKWLETPKNTLF